MTLDKTELSLGVALLRGFWRLVLVSTLLSAGLVSITAPSAHAVSTDCTVAGGSKCTATFSATGSRENWNVPAGIVSIDVVLTGAAGGTGTSPSNSAGGKGAQISATNSVTPGETLITLAGGIGVSATGNGGAGGGGGSFLVRNSNTTALVVAGGGGGGQGNCCSVYSTGIDASLTNDGTASTANSSAVGAAGTGGNGCGTSTTNGGGAGGGWLTDGGYGSVSGQQGRGWPNGSTGGTGGSCASYTTGGNGGFGGGGGACGGGGGGGGGYSGGGGSGGQSNWGGGGGGGSYIISGATGTSSTAGVGTGNGSVTITYLNAPVPTSFTSAQSTPTKTASAITFSITFSQNVNTVANSDFSNSGTATGCTLSISGASGTTFTLTITSCGEGTLIPQVNAGSVYGTVTSTNGPAANAPTTTPITIDRTAPTISSVTTATTTYIPGSVISLTASFSESVTITGSPRIPITIGSTTRYATYASSSDSKTATFQYTVATSASDIDTDGIAVISPLEVNSGSIQDIATNAMSAFSFTPPTTTSVYVYQLASAPTITSLTPGNAQITVNFTSGANGGASISNYKYSLNSGAYTSAGVSTSPFTISGLTNGTSYSITIRAVTAAGDGNVSNSLSASPSTVVVAGGSDITRVYGTGSSSTAFTASGGTSPYTFSLTGGSSGISVNSSSGVVTTLDTLTVGTYSPSVTATDSFGTPRVGSKVINISIIQDTPTVTISLPNSNTSAALGGAITITASVSKDGVINFKVDGVSISGCASVSSSNGSATCSWTPGALGGVVLTALLAPTDSTNYRNATSTNLNITVVNGITTLTLSLPGGVTSAQKSKAITITANFDQAGKLSIWVNGLRIPGCYNMSVTGTSRTCTWKPTIQTQVKLTAKLAPSNNAYSAATAMLPVNVVRRTSSR